jgi:hypothetical protein
MSSNRSSVCRTRSRALPIRRRRTAIAAELLLPDARPIACTIVALSTDGARLSLKTAAGIPNNLCMRAAVNTYRVQATHRSARYLLVRFRPTHAAARRLNSPAL